MLSLIGSLIIGAVAGTLATVISGSDSSNMIKNICIGLVGGIVGNVLAGLIGLGSTNMIGSLILATLGSVVVLWAYNKFIK